MLSRSQRPAASPPAVLFVTSSFKRSLQRYFFSKNTGQVALLGTAPAGGNRATQTLAVELARTAAATSSVRVASKRNGEFPNGEFFFFQISAGRHLRPSMTRLRALDGLRMPEPSKQTKKPARNRRKSAANPSRLRSLRSFLFSVGNLWAR